MNGLARKIEILANVAIIGVALLLGVVVSKTYLLPHEANAGNLIRSGININLPGEKWVGGRRTLLLGLSSSCHFCTESAPFYRELLLKGASIRLVAVMPQTPDEGRKYLSNLGIHLDDVRQVSLDTLGITGTPTLILVNAKGVVTDVWQGKLTPDQEAQVVSRL